MNSITDNAHGSVKIASLLKRIFIHLKTHNTSNLRLTGNGDVSLIPDAARLVGFK